MGFNVKLGCMTRPWMQHPVEKALEGIAQAGYKYTAYVGKHGSSESVTLRTTDERIKELKKACDNTGLKSVAAWAGDPIRYGADGLRRYIEMGAALGLEFLILSSPYSKQKDPDAKPIDVEFIEIIEAVLDLAESTGVGLHVKPHMGKYGIGPGLAELTRRVNHPLFGVSYDPGNIHYYEGLDSSEDIKATSAQTLSVCVKDHRGPKETDDFPPPGEGDVKWEPIWAELAKAEFNGYALIERLGEAESDGTVGDVARQVKERIAGWTRALGGTFEG